MGTGQIRINTNEIPPVAVRNLSVTLLEVITKFYDDPSNVKEFEEWQKRRQEHV